VPPLSKLHRLTTGEEQETQDGVSESTKLINKQLSDLWKVPTWGVTRLDGARGKKQVWRPHVRT